MDEKFPQPDRCSNRTPDGGFWEIGRENADGAITGTVWRKLTAAEKAQWSNLPNIEDRVQKAGSFKIDADGKIKRFPGLSAEVKAEAEKRGAAEYSRVYESAAGSPAVGSGGSV